MGRRTWPFACLLTRDNISKLKRCAPKKQVLSKIALPKRWNKVPPAVKLLSSPALGAFPLAYDRFQMPLCYFRLTCQRRAYTESAASDQFQNRDVLRVIAPFISFCRCPVERKTGAIGLRALRQGAVTVPRNRRTYQHPEIFGNLVPSLP